jgi:hypothetical protein
VSSLHTLLIIYCGSSTLSIPIPSLVKSLCGLLTEKFQSFVSGLQENKTVRTHGVANLCCDEDRLIIHGELGSENCKVLAITGSKILGIVSKITKCI